MTGARQAAGGRHMRFIGQPVVVPSFQCRIDRTPTNRNEIYEKRFLFTGLLPLLPLTLTPLSHREIPFEPFMQSSLKTGLCLALRGSRHVRSSFHRKISAFSCLLVGYT